MNKNNRTQVVIPPHLRQGFLDAVSKSDMTESAYVVELLRKELAGCQHVFGNWCVDNGSSDMICIKCGEKVDKQVKL